MRRELLVAFWIACLLVPRSGIGQTEPPPTLATEDEVEVIEARPERSPDEKVPDLAAVVRDFVAKTNAFREQEKRPAVKVNVKLGETAQAFADYMAKNDRFGHKADGSNAGDRAVQRGYEFGLISENIGYAFNTDGFTNEALGKRFVEGWENSPGHRANMLDLDVTEAGMAVARSENSGYYYAVQLFARPKSLGIRIEIKNLSETAVPYKIEQHTYEIPPKTTWIYEQGRPTEITFEIPGTETDGKPLTKAFKVKSELRVAIEDDGKTVRVKKE